MSGFVKIYGTILESSVWGESPATVKVWIAMLAMADQNGIVHSSLPGLARRAVVSIADCELAIKKFLAPDDYSQDKKRDPSRDGRRIEEVPEGWRLINHQHYRDLRTDKQIKDAERQQRHRERTDGRDMSQMSQPVAPEAEAAPDSESSTSSPGETFEAVTPEYADELRELLRGFKSPGSWVAEIQMIRSGHRIGPVSAEQMGQAIRDYMAFEPKQISLAHFRAFVRRSVAESVGMAQAPSKKSSDAKVRALEIIEIIRHHRKPGYMDQFTDHELHAIDLVTREHIMAMDVKQIPFAAADMAKILSEKKDAK